MYSHCSTRTCALTAHSHLHAAASLASSHFLALPLALMFPRLMATTSNEEGEERVVVYVAEQRTQHQRGERDDFSVCGGVER